MIFQDRTDAGQRLAVRLKKYANRPDVLVLAGAIASGDVRVINEDIVSYLRIPEEVIDSIAEREQQELERREQSYRVDRPPPDLNGRVVILIDDGLATGSTMRAAAAALRKQDPARIVVAVPVSSPETCNEFRSEVDEIVCAVTPEPFRGVGMWYHDFSQTTDEEVRELLERARQNVSPRAIGQAAHK